MAVTVVSGEDTNDVIDAVTEEVTDDTNNDEPETVVDVDVQPTIIVSDPEPIEEVTEEVDAADAGEIVAITALAEQVGALTATVNDLSARVETLAAAQVATVETVEDIDEDVDDVAEEVDDIVPNSSKPHPLFRSWSDWRR